jgi:dTDP-4-dehydrorhamnose reductase
MKILLVGGSGQLGSDFRAVAAGRHTVVAPSHAELDVTARTSVRDAVERVRPDVVVNAAAFHKVEMCERDPEKSFAVNATGAWNIATASRDVNARCVFVSTDYVFDGECSEGYVEDARPGPLNVYGVSKAAGERLVRLACPDSLVVRGSGLFGHAGSSGKGGNFVETMLAKAADGEVISVVDDLTFAPSSTHDMAERILILLERRVPPGIYHVADAGSCTWFGFAQEIFRAAGLSPDLRPRPSGEQAVRRPRSSVLLDTRSSQLGLPPNRHWSEAVAWYLANRPASITPTFASSSGQST